MGLGLELGLGLGLGLGLAVYLLRELELLIIVAAVAALRVNAAARLRATTCAARRPTAHRNLARRRRLGVPAYPLKQRGVKPRQVGRRRLAPGWG